jgi:serine/threonine-protein kinase
MAGEARLPPGVGPGTVIADRYRLGRTIGEGAMGVVFEAEAPTGARVALKLLCGDAAQDPESRARFERESTVSLQLRAPHVVGVHDYGTDPRTGLPFMVMDLLFGEDLERLVGRIGPISPDTAVKIFIQAAAGLGAAHEAGIVHRDVKPSNIFLCHTPAGYVDVRVCDFGAAKIFGGQQLTAAGSVLGTPLYIAPEQLRSSRDAEPRSDVWSLGMTLFYALAGTPALDHVRSFAQLVTTLMGGTLPHVQKAVPWVSDDLARILHGALITKADARCPSARAFGAALARCAHGALDVEVRALAPLHPGWRAINNPPTKLPAEWAEVAGRG